MVPGTRLAFIPDSAASVPLTSPVGSATAILTLGWSDPVFAQYVRQTLDGADTPTDCCPRSTLWLRSLTGLIALEAYCEHGLTPRHTVGSMGEAYAAQTTHERAPLPAKNSCVKWNCSEEVAVVRSHIEIYVCRAELQRRILGKCVEYTCLQAYTYTLY